MAQTEQHTPGRWEAKHIRAVTVEGPCRPVCNPEDFPVAFVPAWEDAAEEACANARLIAAAPELLEALKALRLQALQSDLNDPANEWGWEALQLARAAIASATGSSS